MEWDLDTVEGLIEEEAVSWSDCQKCGLAKTRQNVVFGNGYAKADIMFIGEGPGEWEDDTGYPFHPDAAAGSLFADLLDAVELTREEVFVTNLVGCRPPENRDPMKVEKEACWPRVERLIYLVDPLLIVPVGKQAMNQLMGGEWKSILDKAGKLGEITIQGAYREIKYPAVPIIHPSYIRRKDAIDPRTNRWPENGDFAKTLLHLYLIKDIVLFLRDAYNQHTKEMQGHKALRVIQ